MAFVLFGQLLAVTSDRHGFSIAAAADTEIAIRRLEIPLFPSASDMARQGFLRVINRDAEAGTVHIEVHEDAGWIGGWLTLEIGGGETVHINSSDLENGNCAKGLDGYAGYGEGDWRLRLETALDIEALSYVRTSDGFLTAMHDVVGSIRRVPARTRFQSGPKHAAEEHAAPGQSDR